MRIELLGQVQVASGGTVRSVAGKPAALLCLLSVRDGWVSSRRIAEALWPGRPVARSTVPQLALRLRRSLGDAGALDVVLSGVSGYRLRRDISQLDVDVVQRQRELAVVMAHREPAEALRSCLVALEAWRGEPYGGLDGVTELEEASARLHLLRRELARTAATLVADGSAGSREGGARAVATTAQVAIDYPEDEPLWQAVADGWVALGRPHEAASVLDRLAGSLAGLGLTPGPRVSRLRSQVRSVLAGPADPTLHVASPDELLRRAVALLDGGRHVAAAEVAEAAAHVAEAHGSGSREVSRAWLVVERAAEALGDHAALLRSAALAARAALLAGDDDLLLDAVRHSLRALVHGRAGGPLLDVLRGARDTGSRRRRAVVDAVLAVQAGQPGAAGEPGRSRGERLARCRETTAHASATRDEPLLALGIRCWLAASLGGPDIHDQLVEVSTAIRRVDHPLLRLGLALDRAEIQLALGDLDALERDLAEVGAGARRVDSDELAGLASQVRACVAMARGARAEAEALIDESVALLNRASVHDEVSLIQRWWLLLDDEPARLLPLVQAHAEQQRRPAYRVMVAYTHHRLGRQSAVEELLGELWPEGSPLDVPEDVTYPASLAAAVEMAAAVGDVERVEHGLTGLLAYRDQPLILGAGSAFVLGATARFLAVAHAALGDAAGARLLFERAVRVEQERGLTRCVADTRSLARRYAGPGRLAR